MFAAALIVFRESLEAALFVGIVAAATRGLVRWHCIWVATHSKEVAIEANHLGRSVQQGERKAGAVVTAVALAVLREGAETVLFVSGAITGTNAGFSEVTLAAVIGIGLG